MGDAGGMGRKFWSKFKKDSLFAIYTPFVISLASGGLDSDSFRHFISQDLYFLQAFSEAYKLAEDCADDDEGRAAIHKLQKLMLDELQNRDSMAREWGFELLKEKTSDNATNKYTDFVMAAASGKVEGEKLIGKIATPFERTKLAAYALGAMAPRMRFYVYVCGEIRRLLGSDESNCLYKKWIDRYSSKEFEAMVLQTEDTLEKMSISLTGEELEVMERLYHQAVKLEVGFYSAQRVLQRTVVPLCQPHDSGEHGVTVFCSFDVTCTGVDSSALLAEIAILTAPKAEPEPDKTQQSLLCSDDLRSTWDRLSRQYTREHEQCIENLVSSEAEPLFNFESLCKAIEQFFDFEKKANLRVMKSEVLKGLNLEGIKRAGQVLILHEGCRGFFQKLVNCGDWKVDVHVVSSCWCGDLIRSAFSSGGLNAVKIHSNELAYEESVATGEIISKVESPMEKLRVFKDTLEERQTNDSKRLAIYIGAATSDLPCLLEADVGIVVGSSPSLRKVGDWFGVSFVPLLPGVVKKQKEATEAGGSNWKGRSGVLYTASSWSEVCAFMIGWRT